MLSSASNGVWTGVVKKLSLSVMVRDAETGWCYTILSLNSFH